MESTSDYVICEICSLPHIEELEFTNLEQNNE